MKGVKLVLTPGDPEVILSLYSDGEARGMQYQSSSEFLSFPRSGICCPIRLDVLGFRGLQLTVSLMLQKKNNGH